MYINTHTFEIRPNRIICEKRQAIIIKNSEGCKFEKVQTFNDTYMTRTQIEGTMETYESYNHFQMGEI